MSQPQVQAMNQEIDSMTDAFRRFRVNFREFVQSQEQQSSQRSIEELEAEIIRLGDGAKSLSLQNQELQHQLDESKTDIIRAIDAREASFRKLESAYSVIRDLLNDRVSTSRRSSGIQEDDEEKRRIVEEAFTGSPSSSNSSRTARQHPSPLRLRKTTPIGQATAEASGVRASNQSSTHLPSPEASGNELDDSEESSSWVTVDPEGQWGIHYSTNPPGVSNMSFGPLSYKKLIDYSVISPDEVLEEATDLCLRLHCMRNLVFLNDPMFLEERGLGVKKSYILDWGLSEENANLARFIASKGTMALHTLVFPGKKSRDKVVSKLCDRSQDYNESDIATKLDDGTLSQICIEVSSDGLWEASRDFASRMGYERWPGN
ncbi:hypothetical protein H0H93_000055 [Arthromyces matolae]|nr:hypothetical protein H0H93_000055 [Arthromyces matolae]